MHLETGKGQVNLSQYRYHFLDSTDCKRIVPDDALFINDTSPVIPKAQYNWIEYQGGITPPPTPPLIFKKKKFKWVLYANKLRNRNLN